LGTRDAVDDVDRDRLIKLFGEPAILFDDFVGGGKQSLRDC